MPSSPFVALRDVTYTYTSASEPLFRGLTAHFPNGFTGVMGANGAGKSTLLRLVAGELDPTGGNVEGVADAVYCVQRTDVPPNLFEDFLEDWSASAAELKAKLGIEFDFASRWSSLSHGERKRAQIGCALWQSPSILLVDEPTNHIDREARDLLLDSLRHFDGVGLIVSHDRDLLDQLCVQCIWIEGGGAHVYPGGYTQARTLREAERNRAIKQRDKLKQEKKRLHRELTNRRQVTANEHSVRSKRGLAKKDSDAREKIDRARVSDGGANSSLKQMQQRVQNADAQLADATVAKEYATGIWLEGSTSRRDVVLNLAAGEIELGVGRRLRWPDLVVKPQDRIALTGANGAGKSSFLRRALQHMNVEPERVLYLPQEISADEAEEILDRVRHQDKVQLGQIMNIVSRLNSRPAQLLESGEPSPGEVRKLLLALGMAGKPHVIILDEPTNHLDLPSIESLEEALKACPCALLVVSHDERLIKAVQAVKWGFSVDRDGTTTITPDPTNNPVV